ncbi:metallophosphoesterase [Barnesiella propionica]|uniref:metallophosphoesterase family protein n=1 Tax=Barnesiella propionica TaxID=2981781 RepID=UPI0011CB55DD|nr:metallophosphoesterase family protein [Barnesiella propionica]MCU6768566.1 metallophosphoesterase [Barnesiella propionica]
MKQHPINHSRRKWLKQTSLFCAGAMILPVTAKEHKHSKTTVTDGFSTEPFLQNVTANSITITWICNTNSYSWVEYGSSATLMGAKGIAKSGGLALANRKINKVTLKSLFPGKQYFFRIVSKPILKLAAYDKIYGAEKYSETYSFVMPDMDNSTVTALFLNDLKSNSESLKKLISLNSGQNYDFVCLNGNMINNAESESQLINDIISPCCTAFATHIPLFYNRGNLETRGPWARNFYDYFETATHEAYFSLRWGPVFFIFLDSGEDKDDSDSSYAELSYFDEYREQQSRWLEEQLQSDTAKDASFRIVIMNYPTHHADTCHGVEHCNQLFTPLMNRYHVNVLIAGYSGNSHIYTPDDNHKYSIAIGGNADEGNRTIIQMTANKDKISLKIIGENGELKSSYDADVDALENIKSGTNDIYVSGDKICVNTTSTDAIQVFSANGILLRTITPDSNITYISGLEKQTIYIVKAGKSTKKILL